METRKLVTALKDLNRSSVDEKLTIVISTLSTRLTADVEAQIKAALLYGDEVVLLSPQYLIAAMIGDRETIDHWLADSVAGEHVDDFYKEDEIGLLLNVSRFLDLRGEMSEADANQYISSEIEEGARHIVADGAEDLLRSLRAYRGGAGASPISEPSEFAVAADAGILRFNPVGLEHRWSGFDFQATPFMVADALRGYLRTPGAVPVLSGIHPTLGHSARLPIDPLGNIENALVARIPSMRVARVDKILNARQRLRDQLAPFRAAVAAEVPAGLSLNRPEDTPAEAQEQRQIHQRAAQLAAGIPSDGDGITASLWGFLSAYVQTFLDRWDWLGLDGCPAADAVSALRTDLKVTSAIWESYTGRALWTVLDAGASAVTTSPRSCR